MSPSWLPLAEYSNKYQVSISTLRRRIKTDEIKYQFADGKYLILDEPHMHRPSPTASLSLNKSSVAIDSSFEKSSDFQDERFRDSHSTNGSREELDSSQNESALSGSVLTVANRLLNELKKAYSQILQEKEEQILQLKEEQADLKTLVRVLEAENERLSKKIFTN